MALGVIAIIAGLVSASLGAGSRVVLFTLLSAPLGFIVASVLRPAHRSTTQRLRDGFSRLLLLLGLAVIPVSLITLPFYGVGLVIGPIAVPPLLLGALLYRTRARWIVALVGSVWPGFCLTVLLLTRFG